MDPRVLDFFFLEVQEKYTSIPFTSLKMSTVQI